MRHPGFCIQPVNLPDLRTTGEGDQHVIGHICLADTRAESVHPACIHAQGWRGHGFLHRNIGQARYVPQSLGNTVGKAEVGRQVTPDNLHINRGWQAEIKDLGGQIPRQEGELGTGEFLVQVLA